VSADAYAESLLDRLRALGFREEAPPEGAVAQLRRKQLSLSRFGVVETVVVVSTMRSNPTAEQLQTFGTLSVRAALEGTVKLPRGFGSSLVVYPVLVTDRTSQELTEFVESYLPKHWAMIEFPVVVQLDTPQVAHATKMPVWGSAYYRKTRRDAQQLLAPT
jgi:hypothetical protein